MHRQICACTGACRALSCAATSEPSSRCDKLWQSPCGAKLAQRLTPRAARALPPVPRPLLRPRRPRRWSPQRVPPASPGPPVRLSARSDRLSTSRVTKRTSFTGAGTQQSTESLLADNPTRVKTGFFEAAKTRRAQRNAAVVTAVCNKSSSNLAGVEPL